MFLPIRSSYGQNPPAGFSATTIASGWVQPVGVCFATDGRMVVWEKAGKVWMLEKDASGTYVKPASPLLDLSEEVGDWRDHGLLGLALDPQFTTNGRMYLLYVVDRYYLNYHGINNQPLAGYNPAATNLDKWGASYQSTFGVPFGGSIGRLTRYSARSSDGFRSIDLASRQVLLGETISTGIPVLYETHGIGALAFGSDGNLLVSCGDGASTAIDTGNHPSSYAVQALKDGVITAKENVGAFRSQLIDTHSGKILRVDPQTGDGLASNPYFDASQPRAPRSRVFALGFRNPLRFTVRPGTGSSNPSIGDPGVLYLGDVGLNTWEEMDVVTSKGQNFGWPIYEGQQWNSAFASNRKANADAPNPLYNGGSCNQPRFAFVDLLREDTQNQASFPNPCDGAQQVPDNVPHWVHTRPVMDWKHGTVLVRTASFDGLGNARPDTLGTASSPMTGGSFAGSASMAGVWYTADNFPAQYKNTYFHGDYVSNWLRNFSFNTSNQPVHVGQFINTGAVPVSMAVNNRPDDGALYYVNYSTQEVRRVAYTGNKPPIAMASANKTYGVSPLPVQFSSSGSMDPEGSSVSYLWNFGDGTTSTLANPAHSFSGSGPTKLTVTLTVKDAKGAAGTAQVIISVNNTPPVVHITSPVNNSLFSVSRSLDSTYQLTAAVSDAEQSGNGLTYQWQTVLHHNTHVHAEPVDNNISTTADISPIGCDGQLYYFSISLTVTDAAGLSSSNVVNIYPDCDQYLNVVNLRANIGTDQSSLTWIPPAGVYDEVLIVASNSGISGQPSGDGSSYVANDNFSGSGTVLLGGKAVYRGRGSSQTVTGLNSGLTYYFRAFTRVGTFWSHGTQVSIVPAGSGSTKSIPVITWNKPGDMALGTSLSSAQLNATANVAGSFAYAPAAGTVLAAGNNQVLSVTFSPTDATNYITTSKTTTVNVLPPLSAQWNKRFGGVADDNFASMVKTSDGGYLLAGYSYSDMEGDKSQPSQGSSDYWVVKINSSGTKLWDKRFGGTSNEFLNVVIATSDGGFLLGGSSSSGAGGDKSEASRGDRDGWVVKIDGNGTKLWDKRFGGTGFDDLSSLLATPDGGYLLGGVSSSNTGGDKTEDIRGGRDYWVIKINGGGGKQWDKRFGGSLDDDLQALVPTTDGGYLLGGYSASGAGADKTGASQGGTDYWVVKINASGGKLWDDRYGGSANDLQYAMAATTDGGFLLAGSSDSGTEGDKSEASRGGSDYWVVKINAGGVKLWDKRFGGSNNDDARALVATTDGGCVVAGTSSSGLTGDKTQASQGAMDYWMVKLNSSGGKQWDKRFGGDNTDELRALVQASDNGFVLAGRSASGRSGDRSEASRVANDYWIVKATAASTSSARLTEELPLADLIGEHGSEKAGNTLLASPNPFSDRVTLAFKVEQTQPVKLAVYDLQGKLMATLYDEEAEAGKTYTFEFSAGNHPAGMYLSRLATASRAMHQKLLLAK